MKNNKIPVALVFCLACCLVAVSVSLAEPLGGQGVSTFKETYRPEIFELWQYKLGGVKTFFCRYPITNCKIKDGTKKNCEISSRPESDSVVEKKGYVCPTIESKFITLKFSGVNELSYSLEFNKNSKLDFLKSGKSIYTGYTDIMSQVTYFELKFFARGFGSTVRGTRVDKSSVNDSYA
eukprot:Nk52_evm1s2558 gene=Nk52_evmTU1s2558